MSLLRRVLYLHALAWFLSGALLAVYPRIFQVVLDQPDYVEGVWVRLFGAQAVGLSLLMVLVGHRVEDLWWWSWAFVLTTGAVAALFTLNAAFGIPPGGSSIIWWALTAASWLLGSSLLLGLQAAVRDRPPHQHAPVPPR